MLNAHHAHDAYNAHDAYVAHKDAHDVCYDGRDICDIYDACDAYDVPWFLIVSFIYSFSIKLK